VSQVISRKGALSLLIALAMVASFASGTASAHRTSTKAAANNHPLCSKIGTSIWVSIAFQMWCSPPQPSDASKGRSIDTRTLGSNVNAADPAEDITPSGVRGYGQSETSIAAVGPYVVEAWNDTTAFFAPCPSPMNKEEFTGYGFSANNGASFVDEGGLPNADCNMHILAGDPSVVAWNSGGSAYFYVSSLYFPVFSAAGPPDDVRAFIAINACKASGTGATASISCGQPVVAAASTECITQDGNTFCSGLDKEYLTIDPQRGRLYVSYTEFGINPPPDPAAFGQIELSVCDIGTPDGGTGPVGGTAGQPVCEAGARGSQSSPASPYFVVAPAPDCQNQGSYPAVDVATGNVYVAYEFNFGSDIFTPGCNTLPTKNVVTSIPFTCLTLPAASCNGPTTSNSVNIVTMLAASIPGFNRQTQDFPRIAVSDPAGTVSIVWNDAGIHPFGDILLQSFALGSLAPIQSTPVRLNSRASGGLHFLPALRNADANGNLNVSWYERQSPSTTLTDVFAALNLNPRTTSTPASNTRVTTAATDWLKVTAFFFGDYTDNYVITTASPPFVGNKFYVAWSDGRTGIPQPFEAHTNIN
jgi:hypothetical protein